MKTKFVAISLFFFTIFSSLPAYAESFISANPNVRIIILTFVGKNGTEKKAVPVFRHPLGMEIPSTVTGGAPIRFSYRLVPTVMTINEAMHMTKKDKKTKVVAVSVSNSEPALISIKPGAATPFYIVQSDGANPDKTTFLSATAELLDITPPLPLGNSMGLDWAKITHESNK